VASLSYDGAVTLAEFIHAYVRPDWDVKGIVHALGQARDKGTAAQVAVAALVAAQNTANRTPAVIPLAGPHWPASGAPAARRAPSRSKTCATCYLGEEECRRRWHWDHQFESVESARARVIAEAEGVPDYLRRAKEYRQHARLNGRPISDVELP
jgi:hypothetical protein